MSSNDNSKSKIRRRHEAGAGRNVQRNGHTVSAELLSQLKGLMRLAE